MRHSLGTIAWRGLKGRRRDTAMMLCVLAAVFALLTAVLCYQQSGSRAMEVQRQDLYGAWQLARYDLTAADADAFVQPLARWALWTRDISPVGSCSCSADGCPAPPERQR